MDEQAFQTKLAELMNKIKQLPEQERPTLERLAKEAKKRRERIQASVAELQESLDYLRLTIKYLVFDLEATRRENAYLRKLVEQANREDTPQDEGEGDDYMEGDGSGTE
jgi:chromosome segregation ATPase